MGSSSQKIGVFGGTFDPPHLGHLLAAECVRDELGLDEVRFVVANNPWQKDDLREVTDAEVRLVLTEAALGNESASGDRDHALVVSRVELDAGGPSFTIDTLRSFAADEPDTEWLVIVGADAAAGLDTWHRAEELRELASIVVVNRPSSRPSMDRKDISQSMVPPSWRSQIVNIPAIDISSTAIRERVQNQSSIRFFTPDPVITLIEELGIYRQGS